VVFVVGVEKDILPHIRSITEPDGEEEERRLFYVAMTRSEKMLFVSSCRRRKIGGFGNNYKVCYPSPFLKEAGLVK
jgi:DNA helicase-2/ATP-dependent DNA helicase PcrA